MNILLHLCCGPCTTYPLTVLRQEGHAVQGFFHNPNIHPYREFKRRLAAADELGKKMDFSFTAEREYGLRDYLRQVVFHEEERCRLCYEMRLRPTALLAKKAGVDCFTTTLLYSRYQKHELIREIGVRLAAEHGVDFLYRDFRIGWQEGIDLAVNLDLYRQPYCGCIYSEQERYDQRFRRRRAQQPA